MTDLIDPSIQQLEWIIEGWAAAAGPSHPDEAAPTSPVTPSYLHRVVTIRRC